MSGETLHISVMRDEVLAALAPKDGDVFVDATFGGGGYSRALLEAADCKVFGIDRDPDAIARGLPMQAAFAPRLTLVQGAFGDLSDLMAGAGVTAADGVAFDLGVSSDQISRPERGFSFQADGPLDMRMSADGQSAADVVNAMEPRDLSRILWIYGEERRSRAIAQAIAARRAETPIVRTRQLAEICESVFGRSHDGPHPATRTFQAPRIYVNDELGELTRGLSAAEHLLKPRGRLAVVSFHSLEDRIVKQFLIERSGRKPNPSRHAPAQLSAGPAPSFSVTQRNALAPSDAEVRANPRSRSAKLRAALRTDAPPFAVSGPAFDSPEEPRS